MTDRQTDQVNSLPDAHWYIFFLIRPCNLNISNHISDTLQVFMFICLTVQSFTFMDVVILITACIIKYCKP